MKSVYSELKIKSSFLLVLLLICGFCISCKQKPASEKMEPREEPEQVTKDYIDLEKQKQNVEMQGHADDRIQKATTKDGGKEISGNPEQSSRAPSKRSVGPSPRFRVCTLIESWDGTLKAGLVNSKTGVNRLLEKGDDFYGYAVEEIDIDAENVVLVKDGQRFTVAFDKISGKEVQVAEEENVVAAKREWLASIGESIEMEATPAESARGIDPDDPDTWPKGYRGPGIERMLSQSRSEDAVSLIMTELADFKPIQKELEKDIDPENPDTWPRQYKGPGIERVMLDKEATAEWIESRGKEDDSEKEISTPVPREYEPTPDELSRGIDPNDPATWPEGYKGPAIERSLQGGGETVFPNRPAE